MWIAPALLTLILLLELLAAQGQIPGYSNGRAVTPREIGLTLFGPYVLAVELVSMLLMAALVGAYHLGRQFFDRGSEDNS
jgi:NADH-quinone oxidoreductase subunit J